MPFVELEPSSSYVHLGRGTYGEMQVFRGPSEHHLHVGNFCSVAPNVKFLLAEGHHHEWVTSYPFLASGDWGGTQETARAMIVSQGDIRVGSDVHIGMESIVLSGAVVGDGAVVGARTVVHGPVAPYAIVAGNPMRFVGWRFDWDVRYELEQVRWWTWPDERIKKALPLLLSPDVKKFLTAVRQGEV